MLSNRLEAIILGCCKKFQTKNCNNNKSCKTGFEKCGEKIQQKERDREKELEVVTGRGTDREKRG